MRFFRNISFLALAFTFLFNSSLPAKPVPQVENSSPKILWAFGAIRASSNPPRLEPVTSNMHLSSGDKLKMMIQIRRKCFVYLIHKNSQGDLEMLFPYSLKQFDTNYETASNYYVPKGEGWFQLDSRTGNETFYLIASDQRLLDIEYTYEKYASSEESRKQDLAGQMMTELDVITQRYTASSERIDKLAGISAPELRGFERATGADPTDIAGLAKEISFENIYSETLVVEHR